MKPNNIKILEVKGLIKNKTEITAKVEEPFTVAQDQK